MGRPTNERELSSLLKKHRSAFKRLRTEWAGNRCTDCAADPNRKKRLAAVAEIKRKHADGTYSFDPVCMTHLKRKAWENDNHFILHHIAMRANDHAEFHTNSEYRREISDEVLIRHKLTRNQAEKAMKYFHETVVKPSLNLKGK